MKRLVTFIMATIIPSVLSAREQVEMADTMRNNGKIYVVVAILLVILFGLIAYLIMLDRRITKVEKEIKS